MSAAPAAWAMPAIDDGLPAEALLRQAIFELFPGRIALVSSFGADAIVLLHMVAGIKADLPVLFLDTGKLFPRTLAYRDRVTEQLGLRNVQTLTPEPAALQADDAGGSLWFRDTDACCALRKVAPLRRGLAPYAAWINGRKRFQSAGRAAIPKLEWADGRAKFTPLADWPADQIDAYIRRHDLPRHPLIAEGYASIGCAPCSSPVAPGQDARAGRWAGSAKTECGIHLSPSADAIRSE